MSKKIPHNIEAEQSVLGAVFLDESSLLDIVNTLAEDDFYYHRHKLIYGAMLSLKGTGSSIDYTTISDYLDKSSMLNEAGGLDYLFELSEMVPSTANLDSYMRIVKDKSISRHIIDVCNNILEESYNQKLTLEELIDVTERKVFDVTKYRRTSEFKIISNVVEDVISSIEYNRMHKGEITGLKTGYHELDKYTLGLQKDDLIILAARPAMGKSAFAINIGTQVAKLNQANVALFSLEMSSEQLVSRMLSSEASIDNLKIRSGKFAENEWDKLLVAKNSLAKLNMFFDDTPGIKVSEIRAKCRKLKQENKLDIVIIDYLQLLSSSVNYGGNRQLEVSDISRSLKEMARELKIPVIALSQLSRNVETRESKKPIMSDLRESGSIEQDADIIMFLYREEYYKKDTEKKGEVEVIISKNRHGSIGEFPMLFAKEISLFKNLAPKYRGYVPQHQEEEVRQDIPDMES